jgi:tetratricopeptide (TPR) repeat protein
MKQKLRDLIKSGREKEQSELVPHVDDAPPDEAGHWTAKDQLAHQTAWRQHAAAEMDAVRTGGPGPVVPDDDVANAEIYERTHHQPAASIRESAKSSWDQLGAAVEACSDEDLAKPRLRHTTTPEALWQLIPNDAYYHLAEHLVWWHRDRGDEAGAEEASKWGYEMARSTYPDDRSQGTLAYNLGCFYAVRGRAAEAIPLLRTGIELRPDLREWAKQDTDLDPIRSTPELAGLLG